MNCRYFNLAGARDFGFMRALVIVGSITRMTLHHCPGGGSGESP